jgi:hypothetical protein
LVEKITHPLPSSLALEENIIAVDGVGVDVVDVAGSNADADAKMPMLVCRCRCIDAEIIIIIGGTLMVAQELCCLSRMLTDGQSGNGQSSCIHPGESQLLVFKIASCQDIHDP